MYRGWVKLWRRSLDKGWLRNHKLWALWTWCLMKATHKGHAQIIGAQEVYLKPGQLIFGRRIAAEELGMSEQEIRTRIDFLKKGQNLTIKSTNRFSIITIVNWEGYQSEAPPINQRANHQSTINQPQTRTKEHNKKKRYVELGCIFCVYLFYCQTMGKSPNRYKLTGKKKSKIRACLKDCSVKEIHDAIVACKASPHHMGENANRRPYNDLLQNIIPNREKVEWWNERIPEPEGPRYLT